MFIAAPFTIATVWKQCRCPLIDEWITRCDTRTHTMEYYAAIKKNEVLSWIHLEGIMLNKISPTEKNKYYMVPCLCGI